MFIRVMLLPDNVWSYVNVAHIEGFRPYEGYTVIWLSDRDIIRVKKSPEQILKLIEEARDTKERLRITFEMPSNGKLRQFTVTNEDELLLGVTKDHRTCLFINGLYIDIDLEHAKAREVIESAKVEVF